jgi:hypothetical protein
MYYSLLPFLNKISKPAHKEPLQHITLHILYIALPHRTLNAHITVQQVRNMELQKPPVMGHGLIPGSQPSIKPVIGSCIIMLLLLLLSSIHNLPAIPPHFSPFQNSPIITSLS